MYNSMHKVNTYPDSLLALFEGGEDIGPAVMVVVQHLAYIVNTTC